MNTLTIKIDLEEYAAGLFASFDVNGFKGHGEGWFNTSDIIKFCREFKSLIKNMEGECELVAGQSKSDGSEYAELLGLRCYVISKTGMLGVYVTLKDFPYSDCRLQEVSTVSGELKINVQSALQFTQNLHSLCLNEVSEVILNGQK